MNQLFDNTQKILIVGDVMLDIYHNGNVNRISPEAPVPVVLVKNTVNKLGGAANVANNIAKLHSLPMLLGYCGIDNNGEILKKLLCDNHIKYDLIEINQPTTSKIRVVAGVQQIVRVDFEEDCEVEVSYEEIQLKKIEEEFMQSEVIVLSDYGKGFASEKVCQRLITLAKEQNKILIVDPKGNVWDKYNGATIITPNLKELSDVFGAKLENVDSEIEMAGVQIIKKYNLNYLLVTRSEKGMTFFGDGLIQHIRTEATEVFDVSGAGDTVVGTLATAMASSMKWIDAVNLANKAAGIVVSKMGTEPITHEELAASFFELKENNKILFQNNVDSIIKELKAKDKRIVFTNGCFDIIHKGHIKYLQEAKTKGDILIVGLNSDSSVKKLKGETRPIKDEDERSLILSVIEFIDYVVIFSDETPYDLIKIIQPDVLVKGGDYDIENIVGREFAKETMLISFVEGFSTTSTIEKMKN